MILPDCGKSVELAITFTIIPVGIFSFSFSFWNSRGARSYLQMFLEEIEEINEGLIL